MKKKAQRKTTHGPVAKSSIRRTTKPRLNARKSIAAAAQATPAIESTPTAVLEPIQAQPTIAEPKVAQPSPRVIELLEQLRNPAAERAVEAAEQLAATGDTAAFEPLIAALQNIDGYYHTVVRSAAALALGKLGDARAIEPLTAAAHDAVAEVSGEAILALGELNAQAIVPMLLEIVNNESGYYLNVTRHAAIRTLGRLRHLSAQPVLAQLAISTFEDPAITAAARDALASL